MEKIKAILFTVGLFGAPVFMGSFADSMNVWHLIGAVVCLAVMGYGTTAKYEGRYYVDK